MFLNRLTSFNFKLNGTHYMEEQQDLKGAMKGEMGASSRAVVANLLGSIVSKILKMPNLTLLTCCCLYRWTKEKQFSISPLPHLGHSMAGPHWVWSRPMAPLPLKKAASCHSPRHVNLGQQCDYPHSPTFPQDLLHAAYLQAVVSFYWQAWGLPGLYVLEVALENSLPCPLQPPKVQKHTLFLHYFWRV